LHRAGARRGPQAHLREAHLQLRTARRPPAAAPQGQFDVTGQRLRGHVLPGRAAFALETARVLGTHQQLGMTRVALRVHEQLVEIGLAIAYADHRAARPHLPLQPSGRREAHQPLAAFLVFNGPRMAPLGLAHLLGVTGPHLHVDEPLGHAVLVVDHGLVHPDAQPGLLAGGQRPPPSPGWALFKAGESCTASTTG
jgi:hypothetical protein